MSALPILRQDLEFFPGLPEADGSPTCNIYDPVTGQYTKLGWAETTALQRLRPGLTAAGLAEQLEQNSTLSVSAEDILDLCRMAGEKGLTADRSITPAEQLLALRKKQNPGIATWLLHHYLYFRLPLLKPDRFLTRTLPYARALVHPWMIVLYGVLFLLGLLMLVGRFHDYVGTFPYFFTPLGALAFAATLTAFKVIHEFGHAYTAKAFGVRVRTMGLAIMVFWPVPYCDVTDAWALASRRRRFAIGMAGMGVELALAGMALFCWHWAPDGLLKSLFFVASSTAILSTLMININPAMRYDGYYLLSDLWGIDNLRTRSGQMTRWWLYKTLLGWRGAPPETNIGARTLAGMVVFSLYSWVYRFFLYLGIAVLVYLKFTKALGVILFAGEIYAFFVMPAAQEGSRLMAMRQQLTWNRKSITTTLGLVLVLLWLALPLPRSLHLPAMLFPPERQVIYAPGAGVIRAIHTGRDQTVSPGQPLLRIESQALACQLRCVEKEVQILDIELGHLRSLENEEGQLAQVLEERGKAAAELKRLRQLSQQHRITAAMAGKVVRWDPTNRVGRAVPQNAILGEIVPAGRPLVHAFLPEAHLNDLQAGATVAFVSQDTRLKGTIERIAPAPTDMSEYYALTSAAKGELPVVPGSDRGLVLAASYYLVDIRLQDTPTPLIWNRTGYVLATTPPRSKLWAGLEHLWMVILRESAF